MFECIDGTKHVIAKLGDEPIIASLSNVKRFLAEVALMRPGNFYMGNSMGLAPSIALGLAMARPDQRVVLLDGDGALLMNLSSLATIATRMPPNLIHVVWDNHRYVETGGQPTATAFRTDLARVGEGCGYPKAARAETLGDFQGAFDRALIQDGPWLIVAHVTAKSSKGDPFFSPTLNKQRLMEHLGVKQ